MLFASSAEGISQPKPSWLIRLIVVFLAYGLTGWLGLCVPFENDKLTLFWLPGGIAVAAFYRWSASLWPGIFLAALFLNFANGESLAANILLTVSNTLGPLISVWLLRWAGCNLSHAQGKHPLIFNIEFAGNAGFRHHRWIGLWVVASPNTGKPVICRPG